MAKKMLIDATHAEETRVVVVDGNKVEEFDFETVNKRQLQGNIYLAKVTRVEPSLQAAFVDYGGNRHGFLAFAEIHPDYYQIPVADRKALLEEERALARAGLADRIEFHGVRNDQPIPAGLAARGEILVGWRPAPGLLAAMPKLRWIQSTTAGMENWLADPSLRADILLSCARGAHRIQMPENILGALFFLTKPLVACALDQLAELTRRRFVRYVHSTPS